MLYALNLYGDVCQLFLNKTREKIKQKSISRFCFFLCCINFTSISCKEIVRCGKKFTDGYVKVLLQCRVAAENCLSLFLHSFFSSWFQGGLWRKRQPFFEVLISSVWYSRITQFSSVTQLCLTLCDPMDCSTPGFPSITNSRSLRKLMSIESVMPSNHLILCRPLLLLRSLGQFFLLPRCLSLACLIYEELNSA